VVNGFVCGFGFNVPCAIASTVAHDSHQMIVVGTSKSNMALAANRIDEIEGGVVVFKNGEEIALVELPIAGLMSDERAEVVAAKVEKMVAAFRECGCTLNNAFMQLSLLGLVVIPELRISDKGIVDVTRFEVVPLLID
jgi:adenine deaminase